MATTPGDAIKSQAVTDTTAALATAKVGVQIPTVQPNRQKAWAFWSWPLGWRTQLGSAIRPGEIYRVLHGLNDMGEMEAAFHHIPPELVRHAASLISALRKQDNPATESQIKLRLIAKVSELLAGFDLVPASFPGALGRSSVLAPGPILAASPRCSADGGFLTLGPPFWFNLLKNLMSLRPAVAGLIEKRPTSAPALPAAPATPPSSS